MPTGRRAFASHAWRLAVSLAAAMLVVAGLAVAGCTSPPPAPSSQGGQPTASPTAPVPRLARTLILYDTTGPYAALGELYATQVANLVSQFGQSKARPVTRYVKGEARRYTLTIYIGSTYAEPVPATFLDDAADPGVSVLWLGANLSLLTERHPTWAGRVGFTARSEDPVAVSEVRYKGTALTRNPASGGIARLTVTKPNVAAVLGLAAHADGSTAPWAVRSGGFTYVGEVPFPFLSADDRYLAFADLLFDLYAPATRTRHRALVRIEDVGPQSDPKQLRAIADYLWKRRVPFAVAAFVEYNDPAGRYSGGKPVHRMLSKTPELVAALRYLVAHGGTLVMHGDTHAYAGGPNPYGVSAEDFEFYRAHVDSTNRVVLDGPVAEDSAAWALSRLTAARAEWAAAGIPAPGIFEFPHYAASAADYRAVSADPAVTARYERAMYFSGVLSGRAVNSAKYASQFFPYPVRDVYGAAVIPETLGNVDLKGFNQHHARLPEDVLASAKRQLVVRDGVASFFYHPFLGLQYLPQLVEGIQALGYTFVPADSLILR
jgi:uncharacterized protein YdaL